MICLIFEKGLRDAANVAPIPPLYPVDSASCLGRVRGKMVA
jgi:hypothetical protein